MLQSNSISKVTHPLASTKSAVTVEDGSAALSVVSGRWVVQIVSFALVKAHQAGQVNLEALLHGAGGASSARAGLHRDAHHHRDAV